MPEKVIFVGNDLHGPKHEMAARLVSELRALPAAGDSVVVSIQSRKKSTNEPIDIVEGAPGAVSRAFQLNAIRRRLLSRVARGDIVHFVGNGNAILFRLLAHLCRRAQCILLVSPLGVIRTGTALSAAVIVPVHESLLADPAVQLGREEIAIRPWSLLPIGKEKAFQRGRILFASVPPKESELSERGVVGMIEAMNAVRQRLPESTLIVLNRYPHLDSPLRILAERAPPGAVEIRTGYVERLEEVYDSVDIVVVPSERAHLPQVPMSALDGLARGCPVILSNSLALATDIVAYGAGASISDSSALADVLSELSVNFEAASRAAIRLSQERYERTRGVGEYAALYRTLFSRETMRV